MSKYTRSGKGMPFPHRHLERRKKAAPHDEFIAGELELHGIQYRVQ
jgi:hypothetical protein